MMEERKHLLDYLAQLMMIFGTTILVVTLICCAVGDEGKGYSTMFALGSKGVPVNTVLQYLLSSGCVTVFRFLFFSDKIIKKMSVAKRVIAMLISVIALIGIFAYIFGWFPVDEPRCWMMFLLCFGLCFVISAGISVWKETTENKHLADGLKQLKEKRNENIDRSK